MSSSFTAEQFPLGREVKLILKSKREVSGQVFALDLGNNRVILETPTATPELCDTIMVNLAAVDQVLPATSHGTSVDQKAAAEKTPLFALTTELALRREKYAFQTKEAELLQAPKSKSSLIGVGAPSQYGQELFAALSKTYECRWKANWVLDIVLLGVSIKPPYRHNDVSGADNRAVMRVKELLGKIPAKQQQPQQ